MRRALSTLLYHASIVARRYERPRLALTLYERSERLRYRYRSRVISPR